MNKAVFLDRDGVINEVVFRNGKAEGPRVMGEFKFIKGIKEGVKKLRDSGFLIVVVTNQPDIARRKLAQSELDKMTRLIFDTLHVDQVSVCPHDDKDKCECRKPKAGMIFDAVKKFKIDLSRSFFIGDTWKDMKAAQEANCRGILIDTQYNQGVACFMRVKNINQAISLILKEAKGV